MYKRILLKLSGEALAGSNGYGIDIERVNYYAREIKKVRDYGTDVAVVVGGGNIWRGEAKGHEHMDQPQSHYMGMLATIINALAVQDALDNMNLPTRAMTSFRMENLAEPYIRRRAIRHLEKGRVLIFGGGTGNPFFTTDSAAALRAAEIHAEVLIMAKNGVDGVYSADPKHDASAIFIPELTYDEALNKNMRFMDATAIAFARERKMPVRVFSMDSEDALLLLVKGEKIGSYISS
jgi:uridylate kinase